MKNFENRQNMEALKYDCHGAQLYTRIKTDVGRAQNPQERVDDVTLGFC